MLECAFLLEPCYFLYDNFLSNLFSIGRPKAEEEATVHRLHAEKRVQEQKRIRELNKLRQDEGNFNGYATMETTMGILLT